MADPEKGTAGSRFSGRIGVRSDGLPMDVQTASVLVVGVIGLSASVGCTASPPPREEALVRSTNLREAQQSEDERGAGEIQVVVHNGVITADMERRHEVDQLVAAAEASMRSRGFTLDGRRGRLEEPLRISGRMGGTPDSRRVEVSILVGPTKVRFAVAIKPWGNDAEGRAVMKRMLELLGYGA